MVDKKKLLYPQPDIDERLSTAHTHQNIDFLNKLKDEEALEDIVSTFSASIDLSNVSVNVWKKALNSARSTILDAKSDNQLYGLCNGQWKVITDIKANANIVSDSLKITKNTNSTSIDLTADTISKLNSISGKMNKISNPSSNTNKLLYCGSDGDAIASPISYTDVLTTNSTISKLDDCKDNKAPVAASVVYQLASDLGLIGSTSGASLMSRLTALEEWKTTMDNKTFVTIET